MGEEAFEVLKGRFSVTSYYIDKNNKVIPITMFPYIATSTTTYGIYGGEGAGIRFSDKRVGNVTKSNLFYLIDGKFAKSDKRRQGWWK